MFCLHTKNILYPTDRRVKSTRLVCPHQTSAKKMAPRFSFELEMKNRGTHAKERRESFAKKIKKKYGEKKSSLKKTFSLKKNPKFFLF